MVILLLIVLGMIGLLAWKVLTHKEPEKKKKNSHKTKQATRKFSKGGGFRKQNRHRK